MWALDSTGCLAKMYVFAAGLAARRERMPKAALTFRKEVQDRASALALNRGTYVCDELGLYVQLGRVPAGVTPEEALQRYGALRRPASYVFRYRSRLTKKLREMGLGPYSDVDLREARERAAGFRQALRAGLDPLDQRARARQDAAIEAAKAVTFDQAAEQYIAGQRAGWKNEKHAAQWENTLAQYASPFFGKLPVAAVDTALVLKALEPIWQTKPETAGRLRGRIESVLDWATTREYRTGPNPARWKGHLEHMLASRRDMAGAGNAAARVVHHAALPYTDIGDFMPKLLEQKGVAALALQLTILTALRTSEVLGARWAEFDLDAAEWNLPGERMKMKRPHRVPLSSRAVDILRELDCASDPAGYVFPGLKKGQHLSNMAMLKVLDRMGRSELTVHGFRSSFRDWAAERTSYPGEVAEAALAHAVSDKTEAAYRRGDLFEKRRRLMADWAKWCAAPRASGKVVAPAQAA